jgi:5'-methylthioadenosine phosphorylase
LKNAQQPGSAVLTAEIGVIGGTGFYQIPELTEVQRTRLETPFGAPSSAISIGTLHDRRVAFISRHDEDHHLLPSELPARANIWAFKSLGVRQILTVSAVGSLRKEMAPLHAVIPDQLIDRTRGRHATFFGNGIVGHVAFADPFDPTLSEALATAASEVGVTTHRGGTLVVIDGPAFSTRAESKLYRSWDAAIIGMTALPEAKLAREAELCYGSLCFVTDYDTWHETEADVSSELILQHLRQNADNARQTISGAVASLGPPPNDCECHSALAGAIITRRDLVPVETQRKLQLLLEPHWGPSDSEGARDRYA